MTSIIAFEAAARHGSFKDAAKELNVSRVAVSRQVRNLEEYLGILLFERDANSAVLMELGRSFYQVISANLWAIAEKSSEIAGTVPPEVEDQPLAEAADFDAERARVLLVDDREENLDHISGLLGSRYDILTAGNGADALQIIHSEPLDLVLLDVCMPDLDGFEICRRIKAVGATETLPVMFLTALDSPADETKGLECGASDFISRPIVPGVLRARIKTQLDLRQTQKTLEKVLKRRGDRLQRLEDMLDKMEAQIQAFRSG
ncbi:Stalked cell differentiation-controlling protein [Cognatishimia activa]|uniref:Stalked cell differentiation-controlling protein n=2 Tax=Cognatishimia activa TaxID=1715691 RepID=A0A0P1IMD6_9RHOB|nr:Stalked cell differentiation-controlling protein [Cognatishimia activa]